MLVLLATAWAQDAAATLPVVEWTSRAQTILEGSPRCTTTRMPSDEDSSDVVPTRTTCVFEAAGVHFHKGAPRDITVWRRPLGMTTNSKSAPGSNETEIPFRPDGHYLIWLDEGPAFETVDVQGEGTSVLRRVEPEGMPALAADPTTRFVGPSTTPGVLTITAFSQEYERRLRAPSPGSAPFEAATKWADEHADLLREQASTWTQVLELLAGA